MTGYSTAQTTLETWFERDRAMVLLTETGTGRVLLEVWDEEVSQLVTDGFLKPNDYHGSAVDHVNYRTYQQCGGASAHIYGSPAGPSSLERGAARPR